MSEIDWSTHDRFYEALGWMHAECCAALDIGEDPRGLEVGEMVYRCIRDLAKEGLTKTEWKDGWPPIGQECEMAYSPSGEGGDLSWRWCRTIGFDGAGDMVAEVVSPKFEYVSAVTPDEFRPIQSPEQRMREELAEFMARKAEYVADCAVGEVVDVESLADAILSKYNLTEK